ncbi:MAG: hypothetical protein AMJ81_08100, partial [Phycisphaerae bacterium SM23_33]
MRAGNALGLAAGLLLAAASASGENILVNPGFETPEAWGFAATDLESRTGQRSAYLCGGIAISQQFDAIPLDRVVEISFWIKFEQPGQELVGYYSRSVVDANGYPVPNATPIYPSPTGRWEFVDATMGPNPDWFLSGITIGHVGYAETCFFVDDVRVSVAPEPGLGVLLIAACPCLLTAGRRV